MVKTPVPRAAGKVTTPGGENVVTEAPTDGEYYGRVDGRWDHVTEEAPIDGKNYMRFEGEWVEAAAGLTADEPPPDDKGYVRTTHADNTSQWVPPALPPLATPDEPGLIEEPIADAKGYVRTTYADGRSQWVPPASSVAGDEPPPDDKGYVRTTHTNGVSQWVPPALPPLATPDEPGLIEEPIADAKGYVRTTYADGRSQWVPPASSAAADEPPPDDRGYVRTTHADNTSQWVPPALPPLATPDEPGLIEEPIADDKGYVRTTHLDGTSQWVPPALPPASITDYGIGLEYDETATPPIVNLQPPNITAWQNPTKIGGINVPPRSATQGLAIEGNGLTQAPLATPDLAGSIVEPPADAKGYVRTTQLDGTSQWVPPAYEPIPDFGIGLSVNDGADPGDPPIVHLQPAGNQEKFLGGVFVTPVRGPGQGLDLDNATGKLSLPPATDQHLGGMLEPGATNTKFARMRDPVTGLGEWTELPPDTGIGDVPPHPVVVWGRTTGRWVEIPAADMGIGDVPPDPPQPWSRTTGRWVAAVPEVPPNDILHARRGGDPASWEPFQPFEDVPADPTGQQYSRQHGNWHPLPKPSPAPRPAGKIEAEIGIVYVPDRGGLAVAKDGALALTPAEVDQIGGVREVPGDGPWVRKTGTWEKFTATEIEAGIGLDKTLNTINLQPPVASDPAAGIAPEIGGVYGTPRSDRNAVVIDAAGHINVPEATDLLLGGILEPPPDEKAYARKRGNADVSTWVEVGTDGIEDVPTTPVEIWGRTPGRWVPLDTKGNAVQPRKVNVAGDQMTGQLILYGDPTDFLGAVPLRMLTEAKTAIELWTTTYFMQNPPAGGPYWMLDGNWSNIPANVVTPKIAGNLPLDVGVVYVPARNKTSQGLDLNADGGLFAPPATHEHLGTIVEAPNDGKNYVRNNPVNGTANWVLSPDVKIATTTTLGVVKVPARSLNTGLDIDAQGNLTAPRATHAHAGTIIEPTETGKQYARFRDPVTGINAWQEIMAGGVIISDTPPPNPKHGMLWWESDSGDLFVYYDDGSSAQWVEAVAGAEPGVTMHVSDTAPDPMVSKPKDLWFDSDSGALAILYQDVDSTAWVQIGGSAPAAAGGIAEAPVDGTPYSRQDAAWVSAAAGSGGIADAPADGTEYLRKDNAWVNPTATVGFTQADADLLYEPINTMYTKAEGDAKYFPFAGGTITGNVVINGTTQHNNSLMVGTAASLKNTTLHGYLLVADDQQLYLDGPGSANTASKGILFRKSATESGILHGRICSNSDNYSQGIIEFQLNNQAGGVVSSVSFYGGVAGDRWAWFNAMTVQCADVFETSAAADKTDIRDVKKAEVETAWKTLKPKKFRRKYAENNTTGPLRYGFVMEDMADELTKKRPPSAQGDASGYSIGQVLALTVAKLKEVEAELAALKAKVK